MQNLNNAMTVNPESRMGFLPMLFSEDFIRAESNIYSYADRYIKNYTGGIWLFYNLPCGGGYMAPDMGSVTVCNPENWFEREMSADAAGIFITAIVLNHRSWMHSHHDEEELCTHHCQRYEQLMSFVETHPERELIMRALD